LLVQGDYSKHDNNHRLFSAFRASQDINRNIIIFGTLNNVRYCFGAPVTASEFLLTVKKVEFEGYTF
jgi:hypothetical protein